MTEQKVWLITGAGRGLGVDIAKAALAAGHAVVATARDAAKVAAAVGDHENLLAIKLDVTRPRDARAAVEAAVAKFDRIDILVNNPGNFFAGFFEELNPEQIRNQIETLLFGPMNVTRAAVPVMRKQRSGLLLTVSSTAGIMRADSRGSPLKQQGALRESGSLQNRLLTMPVSIRTTCWARSISSQKKKSSLSAWATSTQSPRLLPKRIPFAL